MTCRESDWLLTLDGGVQIGIECLWRLVEGGRISVTSADDGQRFGLPEPVDAAARVNSKLAGQLLERVELVEGTLDLRLHFANGVVLEVIPESAGYEAWIVWCSLGQVVATGGGEIAVLPQA